MPHKADIINEIQWKQFIKNMLSSSFSKRNHLKTIDVGTGEREREKQPRVKSGEVCSRLCDETHQMFCRAYNPTYYAIHIHRTLLMTGVKWNRRTTPAVFLLPFECQWRERKCLMKSPAVGFWKHDEKWCLRIKTKSEGEGERENETAQYSCLCLP